jgi:putative transferase (TIGR04331 family)
MMSENVGEDVMFYSAVSRERVEMSEKLFKVLTVILNNIHQTEFSERFWSIITAPYVSAVVSNRKVMEKKDLLADPPFEAFVGTVMPGRMLLRYHLIRNTVKLLFNFGSQSKTFSTIRKHKKIAIGFHKDDGILNETDVIIRAFYPFIVPLRPNNFFRKPFSNSFDFFSDAFISNLVKLMPKLYIEHFMEIYKNIPLHNPLEKSFHVCGLENFFISLVVAKYAEHGSKIYYYQHGGFYGEYEYHSAHRFESKIADNFFTWGWKMFPNDNPYKAFRCEKFKKIYVSKSSIKYDILLVFPTVDGKTRKSIMNSTSVFLSNLDRNKYKTICARPRPNSLFNRKSAISFLKDRVDKIDSAYGPVAKLISRSGLVIQISYPSTNMLECFYVDHPVVAILENTEPSSIVKPYYDFFLENGVFHIDMERLTNHINSINLEKWWQEIVAHPTYQQFKYKFLRKV